MMLIGCQSNPKKKSAETAKIYIEMGLTYMKQGRYDLAESKLNHALELKERSPEAYQYLAEIYRKQGRTLIAEESYLRAMKLDKKNASFWNNYAIFLCGEKRYAEAEKWFLKAAERKKYDKRGEAYQNAGMCLLEKGDKVRAYDYFKNSIGIASSPVALYQIALLDYESGDYASTVRYLQRYDKYFKPSAATTLLRAKTEHALKNDALAYKYLNYLTNKFPNSVESKQAVSLFDQLDSALIEAPIIRPVTNLSMQIIDQPNPAEGAKSVRTHAAYPAAIKPVSLLGMAQRILRELGYAGITINERMDAVMQKAILEYQQKEWLSQTGRVDRDLILHLQVRAMTVLPNQDQIMATKGQACRFSMEIKQGKGEINRGNCREDLLPLMRNMIVLYVANTLLEAPAFDLRTIDYDKHAFSIEVPW